MKNKRILLGQLGKRGDCLYATAVARQIKKDFPNSHLTWAISAMCRSVIEGNPSVDEIWELPFHTSDEIVAGWKQFEIEAINRRTNGDYDDIYLTQVHPGNFQNYDGTSRTSIFHGYPRPITVPVEPVVRLSHSEVDNVLHFADEHQLMTKKQVILFECASSSGQSFVDPQYAIAVANRVISKYPDACFILSSNQSITELDNRLIDGSVLSFRENAELTKYCTLLVGCSSGISWLATSDWAKPLPTIQLLSADTMMFASMIHDARYFGLPTGRILEMTDCNAEHVAACIQDVIDSGFTAARTKYHQEIPINFSFYFKQLYWELIRNDEWSKAAHSLSVTAERFGCDPQLAYYADNLFFPCLDMIWRTIAKDDQERITDLLQYKPCIRSTRIIPRNFVSLIKIVNTLFKKDMFIVSLELLYKMTKGSLSIV